MIRLYVLIALLIVGIIWLEDRAVTKAFEEPSYTQSQVNAMSRLVAKVTKPKPDKGVTFRPRNEQERNQKIAEVFLAGRS